MDVICFVFLLKNMWHQRQLKKSLALLSRKPLCGYLINFVFCLSRQHRVKFCSHPCTAITNWTYDPASQILYSVFRICRQKRKKTLKELILPFPQHRIVLLFQTPTSDEEPSWILRWHHLPPSAPASHTYVPYTPSPWPAFSFAAVLTTPACTPAVFQNAVGSFLCLLAGKEWLMKGWVWLQSNQVVHVGSPSSWLLVVWHLSVSTHHNLSFSAATIAKWYQKMQAF